jgi:hypothetical protein
VVTTAPSTGLDPQAMARAAELARRLGVSERQAVEIVRAYLGRPTGG